MITTRDEEIRRRDTIIMNMTEAMKALNPPAPEESSGARESPESPGPAGELGELREELGTERTRREMAESTLHEGMAEEQRRREQAERERDELRQELYALREPRESPEPGEEQQGRGEPHSATVESQEGTQRSTDGRCGGGYSEDRGMQNDQTTQDAKRLLVALSTNHPEARRASPFVGMDRPFSPSWADAEQAGLDRVRRDNAMRWLIDNNMLERDEEAESQRSKGKDLPDYDYVYGSVFRITNDGRELLKEIWEEQRQQ